MLEDSLPAHRTPVDDLDGIEAPEAIQADHDAFVSELRDGLPLFEHLADAVCENEQDPSSRPAQATRRGHATAAPDNGPHNGGCDTCTGVVTIDPTTGKATREADYYVLGHVTKLVKPRRGADRLDPRGNGWNVAFRNPDGATVVLVNDDDRGTGSQRFNLKQGTTSLSYDLPAGAVARFVLD